MDLQEAREKLRLAGFSSREIERLMKLRQKFLHEENSTALLIRRRLEFARWLFLAGRLTEAR